MARDRRSLRTVAAAGLALVAGALLVPSEARGPARPRHPAASPVAADRPSPGRVARARAAADAVPPAAVAVAPAARGAAPRFPGRARLLFGLPGGPPADARDGTPGDVARRVLEECRDALGIDALGGELVVASEKTDRMGHHLILRQTLDGVPVEGGEVAVHVAPDGPGRARPLYVRADLFPVLGARTAPAIGADAAVAAARAALLGPGDEPGDDPDDAAGPADTAFENRPPELFLRPEGSGAALVWRVDCATADESARVSVDAREGVVVDVADLRRAAERTGRARVFGPNPVHSARRDAFSDRRDATSALIEAWMYHVDLPRLDGTGRVRGRWCDAARGRGDAVNTSHDWESLTRSDDAFELVNSYFHVDRTQAEIQRLGFFTANPSAQRVHAHFNSDDQSYYDLYSDEIRFGDGGVDDAEDGDIVVHEYGHAIQDDMVRGFGSSDEGGAVGEGFSDFLACAMHSDPAAPDPAWDPLVAAWDATTYSLSSPPFLRRVNRSKTYPRDVTGEPHADGELWSRLLWDLRGAFGADDSLLVAVGSHSYMGAGADFSDAADAVLVANFHLRGDQDDAVVRSLLRDRGLPFTQPPLDAPNEDAYDLGEGNDDAAHAATLSAGVHADLLLADDDWYLVGVPPNRRVRVQADYRPENLRLGLALCRADGAPVWTSARGRGQEVVEASAGPDGAVFAVRAFAADGRSAIDGYSVAVQETDLAAIAAGRTHVRRTIADVADVVAVSVGQNKVDQGRRIVVTSDRIGRGPRNDVRVTTPSGLVAAEFGAGRNARGARVVVRAVEAGAWRIEVRPRDGAGGRYTLQARFR